MSSPAESSLRKLLATPFYQNLTGKQLLPILLPMLREAGVLPSDGPTKLSHLLSLGEFFESCRQESVFPESLHLDVYTLISSAVHDQYSKQHTNYLLNPFHSPSNDPPTSQTPTLATSATKSTRAEKKATPAAQRRRSSKSDQEMEVELQINLSPSSQSATTPSTLPSPDLKSQNKKRESTEEESLETSPTSPSKKTKFESFSTRLRSRPPKKQPSPEPPKKPATKSPKQPEQQQKRKHSLPEQDSNSSPVDAPPQQSSDLPPSPPSTSTSDQTLMPTLWPDAISNKPWKRNVVNAVDTSKVFSFMGMKFEYYRTAIPVSRRPFVEWRPLSLLNCDPPKNHTFAEGTLPPITPESETVQISLGLPPIVDSLQRKRKMYARAMGLEYRATKTTGKEERDALDEMRLEAGDYTFAYVLEPGAKSTSGFLVEGVVIEVQPPSQPEQSEQSPPQSPTPQKEKNSKIPHASPKIDDLNGDGEGDQEGEVEGEDDGKTAGERRVEMRVREKGIVGGWKTFSGEGYKYRILVPGMSQDRGIWVTHDRVVDSVQVGNQTFSYVPSNSEESKKSPLVFAATPMPPSRTDLRPLSSPPTSKTSSGGSSSTSANDTAAAHSGGKKRKSLETAESKSEREKEKAVTREPPATMTPTTPPLQSASVLLALSSFTKTEPKKETGQQQQQEQQEDYLVLVDLAESCGAGGADEAPKKEKEGGDDEQWSTKRLRDRSQRKSITR